VIVVEATLGIVLSASKLDSEHVWLGFLWMVGTFIGVVLVVTSLTIFCPKNLLYGKEEYVNPTLEPSALKDQIEDLIAANVRPDCLKS
jgi:hypothetical protein